MNFLEFIVELVHYAVWPAAILALVLLFREQLSILLNAGFKWSYKGHNVEVNIPKELQKAVAEIGFSEVNQESCNFEKFLNLVELCGYISGIHLFKLKATQKSKKKITYKTFNKMVEILEKERPNSKYIATFREMESASKEIEDLDAKLRELGAIQKALDLFKNKPNGTIIQDGVMIEPDGTKTKVDLYSEDN